MTRSRKLIVAGAVVLCAGAVAVTQADFSGPERPPDSQGRPPAAKRHFAAFARPDVAKADAAYRARLERGVKQTNPDIDAGTLRLIRHGAGLDMYAAAGTSTVCHTARLTVSGGRTIASLGCGQATDEAGVPLVHASVTHAEGDAVLVTALVPDGVGPLTLRFADGSTSELRVDNNAAAYHGAKQPATLSWTDSAGKSHDEDVSLPESPGGATG
ncbi:MAG TPA: hypothetical protein VF529_03435 [Solirubrobacteraceae bacterium]|jgi:hypothetical protein